MFSPCCTALFYNDVVDWRSVRVKEPKLEVLAALACLLLIFLLVIYAFKTNQPPETRITTPRDLGSPLFDKSMSQDEKRVLLFDRVELSGKQPLTDAEKSQILREFGGERTSEYHFTPEEKEKLLRTMNAY
jgi:hypothetical protein